MRKFFFIALVSVCASCQSQSNPKSHETALRSQIQQLKPGMPEQKVTLLLGHPNREENLKEYKILFYQTKKTQQEEGDDQNYTPVIFRNGYLLDWGYLPYNLLHEEQRRQMNHKIEPSPESLFSPEKAEHP